MKRLKLKKVKTRIKNQIRVPRNKKMGEVKLTPRDDLENLN